MRLPCSRTVHIQLDPSQQPFLEFLGTRKLQIVASHNQLEYQLSRWTLYILFDKSVYQYCNVTLNPIRMPSWVVMSCRLHVQLPEELPSACTEPPGAVTPARPPGQTLSDDEEDGASLVGGPTSKNTDWLGHTTLHIASLDALDAEIVMLHC